MKKGEITMNYTHIYDVSPTNNRPITVKQALQEEMIGFLQSVWPYSNKSVRHPENGKSSMQIAIEGCNSFFFFFLLHQNEINIWQLAM